MEPEAPVGVKVKIDIAVGAHRQLLKGEVAHVITFINEENIPLDAFKFKVAACRHHFYDAAREGAGIGMFGLAHYKIFLPFKAGDNQFKQWQDVPFKVGQVFSGDGDALLVMRGGINKEHLQDAPCLSRTGAALVDDIALPGSVGSKMFWV